MEEKIIRVLLAKPGLDTHDRGIKVVATALRNAGMEIIYVGTFQDVESIYNTAIQEDVDVIGVSFLCGGHVGWVRALLDYFRTKNVRIPLICGGVIPNEDRQALKKIGAKSVYGPGTPLNIIVEDVQRIAREAS